MKMSVEGARIVLERGLDYQEVKHVESTEDYHYFDASLEVDGLLFPLRHEVRVDASRNVDDQFHIQYRKHGAEYWDHLDSVNSDWSQDE